VPSIPSASAGSAAGPVSSGAGAVAAVAGGGKPLSGMQFVVIGKTSKKKAELGKVVAELGGKLAATVGDKVAACISTTGVLVISVDCCTFYSIVYFVCSSCCSFQPDECVVME